MKFKQIFLNLILQSIVGTYRGFLKVKTDITYYSNKAFLQIELENSKFELHKKDNMRIHKLT